MSRRGWALFVAVGVIWGIPYLLIKIAAHRWGAGHPSQGRCLITEWIPGPSLVLTAADAARRSC